MKENKERRTQNTRTMRAEDAHGTPTQSHVSPSILEYERDTYPESYITKYTSIRRQTRGRDGACVRNRFDHHTHQTLGSGQRDRTESSGSNVIPRRARPSLAGLGHHRRSGRHTDRSSSFRANMTLPRQPTPDSGLGFQVEALDTFQLFPLGSEAYLSHSII